MLGIGQSDGFGDKSSKGGLLQCLNERNLLPQLLLAYSTGLERCRALLDEGNLNKQVGKFLTCLFPGARKGNLATAGG